MSQSPERVAKLMARRGLCSRREAERLIAAGQVTVNGRVISEPGAKAVADAEIVILNEGRTLLAAKLTVVLNKPVGVVSVLPERGQLAAWQLLRAGNCAAEIDRATLERVLSEAPTLAVAGRLDRASRGLLLLTQDGTVSRQIIGGKFVAKTYLVRTTPPATDTQLLKLCGPLHLDGRRLQPMRVERAPGHRLRFTLIEGRKHQIRRVCEKVGLQVTDLCRVAIGPIELGDLREGHWRFLTERERLQLFAGD